jgi:hypothetical protein
VAEEHALAAAVASVETKTSVDASSSGTQASAEVSWDAVRDACACAGAAGLAEKWSSSELRDKWKKLKGKLAKQDQDAAERRLQQQQAQQLPQKGSAPPQLKAPSAEPTAPPEAPVDEGESMEDENDFG